MTDIVDEIQQAILNTKIKHPTAGFRYIDERVAAQAALDVILRRLESDEVVESMTRVAHAQNQIVCRNGTKAAITFLRNNLKGGA